MSTINLIVNGVTSCPSHETPTSLGILKAGTKIVIEHPAVEGILCFTQNPKTNTIEPKAIKYGFWMKNLTVIKLEDGRLVVQGWPGNIMYTAQSWGKDQVMVTSYGIVQFNGEFFYVEDKQIVRFHNFLKRIFTTQFKGLPHLVKYIRQLVILDELPKLGKVEDVEVGTVLWYSKTRGLGAVVIGLDEHEELICARVHVSRILGQTGLPVLHAGDAVTWEGSKDLSGDTTTFKTELVGVQVK